MTLADWPSDPVIFLDAENVDGEDNEIIPHGSDVYTWANQGTPATAFAQTDPPQRPLMKKRSGAASAVSFDGRSDVLVCAGSKTTLKFIHETLVFDIAIVLRRKGGARGGSSRVFGSEPKGLSMLLSAYSAGVSLEGGYKFFFNNGSTALSTLVTQFHAPIGEVSPLFIRGTGTGGQLRVTQNFWDWESQAFLAGVGSGDASEDYAIGSAGGAIGTSIWADVDILKFFVWDRNLTAAQLDVIRANFDSARAAP